LLSIEVEDAESALRDGAAQPREQAEDDILVELSQLGEAGRHRPVSREIVPVAALELEGEVDRLLVCLTEGHEAVMAQHDRSPRPRGVDGAGERETGPHVRHDADVWTQGVGHEIVAARRVGERADRVRVDVIAVPAGEKGVQHRLDRGAATGRLDETTLDEGDEFVVLHAFATPERQEVVEVVRRSST